MAEDFVKGIAKTKKALLRLREEIDDEINEAGFAALQPTLEAARTNVPSGHVSNSLGIVQDPEPGRKRWMLGPIRANGGWSRSKIAAVATAFEFGRSGKNQMPPRAWLRQAIDGTWDEVVKILSDRIRAAIERAGKE